MSNLRGLRIKSFVMAGALLLSSFIQSNSAQAVTSSTSVVPTFAWGMTGPSGKELSSPYGVAVGPNGHVYVADAMNNKIKVFTSDGSFVREWGGAGSGEGEFDIVADIAVASNGDVYAVDMQNARIQQFTSDGTFVRKWGSIGSNESEFIMPIAIAVAPSGDVYVSDSDNVQRFGSDGAYKSEWGLGGMFAYDIAIARDGDLYLAFAVDKVVKRFSPAGIENLSWGTPGTGDGQFDDTTGPMGLAIVENGHVYVTDIGNNRVQEFTSEGVFVAKWGTAGSGDGQFNGPYGIASDTKGNVYVADSMNQRIQRYFFPQNLITTTALSSDKKVKVTLPEGCDVTDYQVVAPPHSDAYHYPLGVLDFTFSVSTCSVGATVPIAIVFQTELTPDQVTPRKYNSRTGQYGTIAGATMTETTVDGNHAIRLAYSATDGGELDEDGVANGVIVDPVGLAVAPGAPSTGVGGEPVTAQATALLILAATPIIARRIYLRSQSF